MGKKLLVFCIFMVLIFSSCSKQVVVDTSSEKASNEVVTNNSKSESETLPNEEVDKKIILNNMPKNYSYEITTTSNDMTISFKYYRQDDNYRMEMEDPNTHQKTITIVNQKENVMYIYMPEQNMATKTSISEGSGGMMNLFDMNSLSLDEKILNEAENIEEVEYNGEKVYYIEVSSPMTEGVKSRMWISKKYSLPIKMENEIDGNVIYTTTINNINEGPFDKKLFEIPEGVTVNSY